MYSAFVKYKENKQLTVVEGPGIMMGDTELDALLASSLETPVVLTLNGHQHMSVNETFNHVVGVCLGGEGEGGDCAGLRGRREGLAANWDCRCLGSKV